jgi:hypothetical protein
MGGGVLLCGDAEESRHLFVEEALARAIRLDPFAVEDKLRDGMFADVGEELVSGAGRGVDIDLFVGDGPVVKKAFGSAAVAAPGGRIDEKFHRSILLYENGDLYFAGTQALTMVQAGIGKPQGKGGLRKICARLPRRKRLMDWASS